MMFEMTDLEICPQACTELLPLLFDFAPALLLPIKSHQWTFCWDQSYHMMRKTLHGKRIERETDRKQSFECCIENKGET